MQLNSKTEVNLRNALNAISVMVNEGNVARAKDFLGLFCDIRLFYKYVCRNS